MGTSTKQIENYKNFEQELRLINLLESLDSADIEIHNFERLNAKLTKTEKNVKLEFNTRLNFHNVEEDEIPELKTTIDGVNLLLSSIGEKLAMTHAEIGSKVIFNETYSVGTIKTKEFTDEFASKFRCFIPVSINKLRTFHNEFETVTYQDNDGVEHYYDCIRIVVDKVVFDIIQLKQGDKGYYIIESINEVLYFEFENSCFAIRQALGFFTRYMPGGEEYTFTNENDLSYTNRNRPDISSMYKPIDTNPYNKDLSSEKVEEYSKKLTRIPPSVLSCLVSRIKHNHELSSSIILLLEASSIHSLLLIPSIFSVIIESLAKIFSTQEEGKVYPILIKELRKNIIDELTAVIDKYATELNEAAILKLKRRINDINKPVVKEHLTNNEKLIQPFQQLGIRLSIEDIQAIEHRNDLLHGDILLKGDGNETPAEIEKDTNNYMAYISAKLYSLISMLILKYIGYSGYVVNHAKFHEKYLDKVTNEENYILI